MALLHLASSNIETNPTTGVKLGNVFHEAPTKISLEH